MNKFVGAAIVSALVAGCVPETEVVLVEKGEAKAYVALDAGASASVTNAATALVHWVKEKTGAELSVLRAPSPAATTGAAEAAARRGLTPITFQKLSATDLTAGFSNDGFRVEASADKITISAIEDQGFEFAVHYLLSRYAGIDWFHPESGADFEKSDTLAVPAGTLAKTPPREREGAIPGNPKPEKGLSPDQRRQFVYDWNIRNGCYSKTYNLGGHVIGEWILWTPVDEKELQRELDNIHTNWAGIFRSRPMPDTDLMYAKWKILVRQHPDWFALVDGKRVATGQNLIGNGKLGYLHRTAMPCLSNPEVREQMLKNYIARRRWRWHAKWPKVCFTIHCDDQPCWCECDNCMKLIKFKGTGNADDKASDYYWDFVNWIAPRMLAADPTLTINASAYQSHRAFPTKVKPMPQGDRLNLLLCTHGRCYLHSLTNAACARNADTLSRIRQWKEAGFPVTTFEYHGQTAGRCDYYFWERAWIDDLKLYHSLGVTHSGGYLLGPWFGWYGNDKCYFDLNNAKSKWFFSWLAAHFYWDPDDDFDTVRDRILTKYYRSAGKEMLAYHKYLEKKVYDAPVHMPYIDTEEGFHDTFTQIVAGRPGVLKPAQDLLAAARKAAADDPKALERIAWDEKYFKEEWELAAPLYGANWTKNRYKGMRPLGPNRYSEWYIMIGSVDSCHEHFARKMHVSYKVKGKATGRFEWVLANGKTIKMPLGYDTPNDWQPIEFDLDTGANISYFRLYETEKLEFKDFTITSVRID